jgi:hypothetical protein
VTLDVYDVELRAHHDHPRATDCRDESPARAGTSIRWS